MRHKENHLNQDELIEHFYKESLHPDEVEDHIRACQSCRERYDELKRDLDSISDHFRHDFWQTQRKKILSEVNRIRRTEEVSLLKWLLKPAFVTIMIIVLFVGIYSRLNHAPIRYTAKDKSDEIFLEHVAELIEQPITSSLDYLDFQDEDTVDQGAESIIPSEKLDLFGFWPELGA
jgi:hypothetical protein